MKIWVDVSCSFLIEAENHDEAREEAFDRLLAMEGRDIAIEGTDDYN